jgi:quinolinate synthase
MTIMILKEEIVSLKKKSQALILAHYYQRPEIQDIADAVGDSYYLSKLAMDSKENLVVFCGVKFMAESAKILSPDKTILLPNIDAGCPMADMADEVKVLELKKIHPNAAVVCYINSSTEVKALCDVCVTSSNALKIIRKIPNRKILFIPDKNLGQYLQDQLPEKEFILWDGFCITHKKVLPEYITKIKEMKPGMKVLVHPECEKQVRNLGDFIGSTGEIISYATNNSFKEYLIVTEDGVLHELKKKNPEKTFYVPGKTMTCMNMKKTTLEDVYNSLLLNQHEVIIEEDIRLKAYSSLAKMHEMAR